MSHRCRYFDTHFRSRWDPPGRSGRKSPHDIPIAGNERVRVWVVRIAQEADYRVDIDGEVYGPYKPTLTFGHVMRNDSLHWLLTIGTRVSWVFFICVVGVVLSAVFGTVLGLLLRGRPLPARIGRAEVAVHTVGESVNRARKFGPVTFPIPCVAERSDHYISGTTASADANERADLKGGTS